MASLLVSAAESGPYLLSVSSTFMTQGHFLVFDVPLDHTLTGAVYWSVSALNECFMIAYNPETSGYLALTYGTFKTTFTDPSFLPQSSSFNVWLTNDGFPNTAYESLAFLSTNSNYSLAPWAEFNAVLSPAALSAACSSFPDAGFCPWLTDPSLFQYSETSVIPGGTWYLAGLNPTNPPVAYGEAYVIEFGDIQLVAKPTTSPAPPVPSPGNATEVDGMRIALITLVILILAFFSMVVYLYLQKDAPSSVADLLKKLEV